MLPTPTSLPVRVAMMLGAVVLNAISTVLYIGAGLGPGPRDGLMTGLVVAHRPVGPAGPDVHRGHRAGGRMAARRHRRRRHLVYAFGIGPLVQFFVRITPKRVLARSGWAFVPAAGDLGVKSSAGRRQTRRNA